MTYRIKPDGTRTPYTKISDRCSCNGEAHDECRPCADCGEAPALNGADDGPDDDDIMWLCDTCHEERVAAAEQLFQEQRAADERPLTKQQQAWFDAYTGDER